MARISLKERDIEHKKKRRMFIADDGVRPLGKTKREGGGNCSGKTLRPFYTVSSKHDTNREGVGEPN